MNNQHFVIEIGSSSVSFIIGNILQEFRKKKINMLVWYVELRSQAYFRVLKRIHTRVFMISSL